jgi:hypothetical protein
MSTVYLFGDEAGNFDFSDGPGASRYFILATVTMSNCQAGDRLQALRRRLAWQGIHLGAVLHATEDPQPVRDEVFHTLALCEMQIDATIIGKHSIPATMRNPSRNPATGCSQSRPISGPGNVEAPFTSRSTTPSVPPRAALTASRSDQI